MLEGPVKLMGHVLYAQGKGYLGSAHTGTLDLAWTCLSQIVPHTYKKHKHYQGIYFPQEAVHYQPKETNTKKKKALMMQPEPTFKILFLLFLENNKGSSEVRGQSMSKRIFYGISWLLFYQCLNNRVKILICVKQKEFLHEVNNPSVILIFHILSKREKVRKTTLSLVLRFFSSEIISHL